MHGAEITTDGVRYCLWAPEHRRVEVLVAPSGDAARARNLAMQPAPGGYHHVTDHEGRAGDRYRFRLGKGGEFPDPASHAQAETVHGPSVVVDPREFRWSDSQWRRPPFRDLVIYELHVGTFTREGTFRSAIEKLPHLKQLGVTAIELMPIGDFPGRWGWGYDGVLIYAPARAYGSPDDLRALVDAAHTYGLAVILDVVYNHFGPDGNYLAQYSRAYFNEEHHTPWGAALNFDAEGSFEVRDFFIANPVYWMEQFHIDGFRFDATHAIIDNSRPHILADLASVIHARGGYAIAEDSRNESRVLESAQDGGYGFDGVWADDFHHIIQVAQTGVREGYFKDFHGTVEEAVEVLQHGWLYRGQPTSASKRKRGTECRHLPPSKFVHCISNHDQSGNRAFGERPGQLMPPEAYRAVSMLLCLTPYTPMIFMGQEWSASTPFLYFSDHHAELGALITEGRRREFADFSAFKDSAAREQIPDPQNDETFWKSKLNWEEISREDHAGVLALYAACLQMRRECGAFRPTSRASWAAAALSFGAGALQFRGDEYDYLLVFNLSGAHGGTLQAEGLPMTGSPVAWELLLSSEEKRFGGSGTPLFDTPEQSVSFRHPAALLLRGKRGDA
jgi:maltooligosyltrehalose trehalohydrolase